MHVKNINKLKYNWIDDPYLPTRPYEPLDIIFYFDTSYLCIKSSVNNLPTNVDYWKLIVKTSNITDDGFIAMDENSIIATGSGQRNNVLKIDSSNNNLIPKWNTNIDSSRRVSKFADVTQNWMYMLYIMQDGSVTGLGYNGHGELGLGHVTNIPYPMKSILSSKIIQVATGERCSFTIDEDGYVYSTGYNNVGQLGLGDTANRSVFTKIPLENVIKVACSIGMYQKSGYDYESTYFLTGEGKIYSCGRNGYGQLGHGDTVQKSTPTLIETEHIFKDIYVGRSHYVAVWAVTTDDEIVTWGYNVNGELGDGTVTPRYSPIDNSSLMLDHIKVRKVAQSPHHCAVLTYDGQVYAVGNNGHGQLGTGNTSNQTTWQNTGFKNIVDIHALCQGKTVMLLDDKGIVRMCGYNAHGQLGDGTTTNRSSFVTPELPEHSKIIKMEGNNLVSYLLTEDALLCAGYGNLGSCGMYQSPITKFQKIPFNFKAVDIATYGNNYTNHTSVNILSDRGEVYSMGSGYSYQNGVSHNSMNCFELTKIRF
jgi:alpha-tubulin suppressor-like RCC1 family protein